jgi:hypothetical protein
MAISEDQNGRFYSKRLADAPDVIVAQLSTSPTRLTTTMANRMVTNNCEMKKTLLW